MVSDITVNTTIQDIVVNIDGDEPEVIVTQIEQAPIEIQISDIAGPEGAQGPQGSPGADGAVGMPTIIRGGFF